MRRDAREAVYKLLFSNLFGDEYEEDFKKEMFFESKLKPEDTVFADKLLSVVKEHGEEIKNIISDNSKGYKIDRIYSTDFVAMEIAVAELTYFTDIPHIVSIDEALWLVRKYSTENSLNFVNGVLANYNKKIEAGGAIQDNISKENTVENIIKQDNADIKEDSGKQEDIVNQDISKDDGNR